MHKRALIWIQITLTHTAFVCQHLNKSVHGSIYDRLTSTPTSKQHNNQIWFALTKADMLDITSITQTGHDCIVNDYQLFHKPTNRTLFQNHLFLHIKNLENEQHANRVKYTFGTEHKLKFHRFKNILQGLRKVMV